MLSSQYSISKIKDIISATGAIVSENSISVLLTDSRRITSATEALFFALSGRRNGHEFIAEAYAAGVRNFVVNHGPEIKMPGANILIVDDVLFALQKLAAFHRDSFKLKVIGITGSNGKTIVKEWLYQLMATDHNIVRNPKSYNSQIGVPLSLWQINDNNDLGIFEAGISTTGEMERLEAMIKPDIGILTHIGSAHDEGFESREQKVLEKLGLFKNCKLLIHNYDELINYSKDIPVKEPTLPGARILKKRIFMYLTRLLSPAIFICVRYKGSEIECLIPFLDKASFENAITCWATMLAMGYTPIEADKRIERLTPVSMRLELKTGVNNCSVIDDSYNSDIQSLEIALNFLSQQNQHQKKTLILSDIFQSGLEEDILYDQVADMIKAKKIDKFIGVGEALFNRQQYFDVPEKHFFADTAALLKHMNSLSFRDEDHSDQRLA
jgi:UDP-N-acetylmuramoyl-tripeptide--D-alanyl-D-alanine ligase